MVDRARGGGAGGAVGEKLIRLNPAAAVVEVDDAAARAEGDPAAAAQEVGIVEAEIAAQGDDGRADGAVIDPAPHHSSLRDIVLADFAVLPNGRKPVAIAPPCEVRNAAARVYPARALPLHRCGGEHVDGPAAFLR